MVEARVPDELRDWNAMDIFIFSNGQQYSPPRKYHLCSDDLKFWDSTVSFLAHSQYGSLHSKIELYTIEGRRVEGPLELHNDAAYVAVSPPDPFIQSGYDKYLLKASRSWEKRQGKILSGIRNPMHEKIHVSGNLEITTSTNKPVKDDSVSTTETGKCSKISSATKHKPLTATKPSTRSSSLIKDPVERRKLLTTKAILRKGKLSDSSTKRDSSLIKNLGVVDKSVIKQGLTPSETPIIDAILETESSASAKKLTKNTNVSSDNGLDVILEKNEHASKIKPNNNVYKNPVSETESMIVDVDKDVNDDITMKIESNTIDNTLIKLGQNESVDNVMKTKDIGTQKSWVSVNEKLQQTKECTFNLNLNIEVHNRSNSINNMELRKCFSIKSAEQSMLDVQKEKVRENIDPVMSKTEPDNTKVVVVRCSCSSHRTDNKIFALANEKDKDYFILVPTQGLIKVDSCRLTASNTEDGKAYESRNEKVDDIVIPKKENDTAEDGKTDIVQDRKALPPATPTPLPNKEVTTNTSAFDKSKLFEGPQTKSTQTDWCDLLLEARHSPGGYTLHLPSIQKLKEYKL
ncbi:uncharacterized protein LOC125061852 [Pieris napi]|uniref:uncharacterized protein LOC125061852 n=1 Tax=Pieris napi TaxID=78633 RepID=UPI001FBABB0B|nr:uncharacterized protein LOC125061852 [Pieris napi]